jgi:hypothetical protein
MKTRDKFPDEAFHPNSCAHVVDRTNVQVPLGCVTDTNDALSGESRACRIGIDYHDEALGRARRNVLAVEISVGTRRRAQQQGLPERPLTAGIERLEKLHFAACQQRYRKTVPVEEPAAG